MLALACILPFLIRGADTILSKIRYTSICIHCGEQSTAHFYYVLDSEIAQSEKILPMSRLTLLPGRNPQTCPHEYVLVGKTVFNITRTGTIFHQVQGQPAGDREFERAEVKNTFLTLSQKNPAEAPAFIRDLAKARYRGRPAPEISPLP
ncbi:MAG: hypothetical protein ACXW3L_09495 [Limisphaerales bacterium]